MNRREFVKSLGVMAAASFVPVAYAAKSKLELEYLTCGWDNDRILEMVKILRAFDTDLINHGFEIVAHGEAVLEDNHYQDVHLLANVEKQFVNPKYDWLFIRNHIDHANIDGMVLVNLWRTFKDTPAPTNTVISKFSGVRMSVEYWYHNDNYAFDFHVIKEGETK